MTTLREFLEQIVNQNLIRITISGNKNKEGASKIGIRPIELKDAIVYQASEEIGTQIFHRNYSQKEITEYIEKVMPSFGQLQAQGCIMDGTVLVSKKGKMTIKTKMHAQAKNVKIQSHNRVKQYVLKEGIPVPFLVDLGVMTAQGKIVTSRYDKFRQINRFLEYVEDILPELKKDNKEEEVTILDFGCGKSYLTFALYYYLKILKKIDVSIVGLDLKTDVIKKCNSLAEKYGYEKLHFYQGDIAQYEDANAVDMVVTLHACDVATDYALAKAVGWNAKVILSVPCCQHELNGQIKNEMLNPIFQYGILKERMSALITDGIRAELLATKGYETQILEFIDMEHTPKNLLIRAVKTGKTKSKEEIDAAIRALHVHPMLERLLYPIKEPIEGGQG